MQYRYFIGEGEEAKALIDACHAKLTARNAVADTFTAWAKDNGWDGGAMRGNSVVGVISARELAPSEMSACGVKCVTRIDSGWVYAPIKNRKASAAMREAIAAARMEDFSASDHIIKVTGMIRAVVGVSGGRTCLGHSVAGYQKGAILVQVPAGGGEHDSPMPIPPAWLREVKESEFLAAQGR
jgi:hypothetical protein